MAGVYISYPFCSQKCSFCNFSSGVSSRELKSAYFQALLAEIQSHEWTWTPDTVYLGGGTPSHIDPAELDTLLEAIPGRPWSEATIEAAPGSLDGDRVSRWKDAGINRVSLGVQSFVDVELSRTGRKHNAATVFHDCELLRSAGIKDFNIDLIAGLPYQTRESWNESLDCLERIAPTHASVYLFEIDEDSRLGLEVLNGGSRYSASKLPSEELAAELYETAVERLAAMGLRRYEISNFAVSGRESKHNLKYWLLDPYVGFGADAHSFDGKYRWSNPESAEQYVRLGREWRPERSETMPDEERFFVGLRLSQGVELEPRDVAVRGSAIERFIELELLERSGNRIRLTEKGVLFSNEVFQEFVA